jgi:hypothetical protein
VQSHVHKTLSKVTQIQSSLSHNIRFKILILILSSNLQFRSPCHMCDMRGKLHPCLSAIWRERSTSAVSTCESSASRFRLFTPIRIRQKGVWISQLLWTLPLIAKPLTLPGVEHKSSKSKPVTVLSWPGSQQNYTIIRNQIKSHSRPIYNNILFRCL